VTFHVQKEDLQAGIRQLRAGSRSQIKISREGSIYGDSMESQMVFVAGMGGKENQVQAARCNPAPVSYTHLDVYKRQR